MTVDIYNLKHEKVGTIDLPEGLFGVRWNSTLVKQALDAQMANRRSPWAHAKTRAEVRGGGKKPWRQKGTGRARHGSTRSPLWVGGGKSHGPNKERDYSQKINKKMKKAAIAAVLSKKFKDSQIIVIDSMAIEMPKTKVLAALLRNFTDVKPKTTVKKWDMLLVPDMENKAVFRAGANLAKGKVTSPSSLNVYDLMNYKRILIDKQAIPVMEKNYQ